MKQTSKNIQGLARLRQTTRTQLQLTGSGKVHDSFGILAEFTTLDAAKDGLAACGFIHDPAAGRAWPVYKRNLQLSGVMVSGTNTTLAGAADINDLQSLPVA